MSRYGWVRDLPDQRDFLYAAPVENMAALPPGVDLRPECPKTVYDQGQLGSSTANAIAGALEFEQIKQSLPNFTPSRLFIYYNERVVQGTVGMDSGAQIRDGMKVVSSLGAPPETDWAYNVAEFAVKPPAKAYKDAPLDKGIQYQRLPQVLSQMKGCLASGYPFVYGFTVYESFESTRVAQTGLVPIPSSGEKVLGGYAVMVVGYDDSSQRFIVRCSWGPGWGMGGYCTIPYAYLMDPSLAADFWTVRLVGRINGWATRQSRITR
jgi:C1A family cysteine protease